MGFGLSVRRSGNGSVVDPQGDSGTTVRSMAVGVDRGGGFASSDTHCPTRCPILKPNVRGLRRGGALLPRGRLNRLLVRDAEGNRRVLENSGNLRPGERAWVVGRRHPTPCILQF